MSCLSLKALNLSCRLSPNWLERFTNKEVYRATVGWVREIFCYPCQSCNMLIPETRHLDGKPKKRTNPKLEILKQIHFD